MRDRNHAKALEEIGAGIFDIYVARDQSYGWSETFRIREDGSSIDYSQSTISFKISLRPGTSPLASAIISSKTYDDPITTFVASISRSTLDSLPTSTVDELVYLYFEIEVDGRLTFAGDFILVEGIR